MRYEIFLVSAEITHMFGTSHFAACLQSVLKGAVVSFGLRKKPSFLPLLKESDLHKKGLLSNTLKIFWKIQSFSKKKKGLFSKISQIFGKIQVFSRKNLFKKIFARSLAFFKTRQNWSIPWPISTSHKIVLSSSQGQTIFGDLQGSRPRPRTN